MSFGKFAEENGIFAVFSGYPPSFAGTKVYEISDPAKL